MLFSFHTFVIWLNYIKLLTPTKKNEKQDKIIQNLQYLFGGPDWCGVLQTHLDTLFESAAFKPNLPSAAGACARTAGVRQIHLKWRSPKLQKATLVWWLNQPIWKISCIISPGRGNDNKQYLKPPPMKIMFWICPPSKEQSQLAPGLSHFYQEILLKFQFATVTAWEVDPKYVFSLDSFYKVIMSKVLSLHTLTKCLHVSPHRETYYLHGQLIINP